MGIIRGGLLVVVCVLFLVGMIALNTLFTVGSSLEPQNVKENFGDLLNQGATEEFNISEIIGEGLPVMQKYCENNTEFDFETNLTNFDVNLSCESVNSGTDAVLSEFVNETIDEVYYIDYNCEFVSCFEQEQNVFYVISKDFKDYIFSKFYITLIVVIVLFLLIFLLTENRANAFVIAGILIIVSALPFLKAQSFVSSIGGLLSSFLKLIFSESYMVFVRIIIIGIIVLGIGIILRFINIGLKISGFFGMFKKEDNGVSKEEVKNIVKEEVGKSKDKSTPNKKGQKEKKK